MRPRIAERPQRRYRRCTVRVQVEYTTSGRSCVETATTLGAGGLFIETQAPLFPGTQLVMRFRVTDDGETHEIKGRVVWARQPDTAGGQAGGMGIEFTERDAAVPLAIELERL